MVLAAHDVAVVVKVRKVDASSRDIVGRSYNKKNSTEESKKTNCATDREHLDVPCEISAAPDVMIG